VLPDPEQLCYVEYKLFNALIEKASPKTIKRDINKKAVREVMFSSRWIECLTGKTAKGRENLAENNALY